MIEVSRLSEEDATNIGFNQFVVPPKEETKESLALEQQLQVDMQQQSSYQEPQSFEEPKIFCQYDHPL